MPKRIRRSKRPSRRKFRRKGRKLTIKRGRRFSAKIPRPIKLKEPSVGFAPTCNTVLRYTETVIIDPKANEIPASGPFGAAGMVYASNSLVAPNLQFTPPVATSLCFAGLEDYSRVYSNYRVNSSRIRCRVFPHLQTVSGDTSEHMFDCPSYFTLYRTNELPGQLQDAPIQSLDDMRAKGHRFIKIDPSVINVTEHTGYPQVDPGLGILADPPTPLNWPTEQEQATFVGHNYGVIKGRPGGQTCSTGWSVRYCSKDVDNSQKQAFVNKRPEWLGGYQLLSLAPYIEAGSSYEPLPTAQSRDPCPIEVQITIEAKVSFWRKRMYEKRPRLSGITNHTKPIDPPDV